ncbi:MAG: DUF1549 domain-containing protein [Planctomycetaceae bacterium]
MNANLRLLCFAALMVCLAPSMGSAQESLRQLIDRELAPPPGITVPVCSDAEFLRRVSLDLNGMPPTADEARAFLTDADPSKREKLIDRLLASPLYARHLASTLDVMLMERRANTHVAQDAWMAWLVKSVRENKPWNTLAKELMTADGEMDNPDHRAASRFILDRGVEPNIVARDVGRFFFGRDLQCAQCHDSPLVADFLQKDYQGLLAITSATYAVTKKINDKDVTVLGERSGSDLTFESVFSKGNMHRTGARLPGGTTLAEQFLVPGEDYVTAPADGIRAVPKVSRRSLLAEQATNGSNRAFNENAANRLWSFMFGRGLVHPLDMIHPDNPAVSPALLQQLGERLAASNFDMKNFLREIALSQTYQRPFDLPAETTAQLVAARAEADRIAQQKAALDAASTAATTSKDTADDAFLAAEKALLPVAGELDAARNQYAEAKKKLDEAQKALADATSALTAKQQAADSLNQSLASLKNALAALPDSQDLAATASLLETRTTAVNAELPALKQAVTDKTTATTAPQEAAKTARTTLEGAAQKLQPLLDAVRAEEAKVVAARSAAQNAQAVLRSAEERLSMLDDMKKAGDERQELDAATTAVASAESQYVVAKQQVSEMMPVIQQKTESLKTAETTRAAAAAALTTAQQTMSSQQTVSSSLTDAKAALDRAVQALADDPELKAASQQLTVKAEAAAVALKSAESQMTTASQQMQQADELMKKAQAEMNEAQAEFQRRQNMEAQMNAGFEAAKASRQQASDEFTKAIEPVPTELANHFMLAQLKHLSPEQLCWTVFRVTRVYDNYRSIEIAELDKTTPLTDAQKQDPAVLAQREIELEQRTWDKLKGNIGNYVPLYGGAPGQPQSDFYASPDQALFTSNGGAINSWVGPSGGNATERIIKASDPKAAAEELYLGILTRMPTDEEVADVTSFLASRPDRNQAAKELVWGLLSSAEFRFNH